MNAAESDSDVEVQFSKAKTRSPPRHRLTEIDGLYAEDILLPLVEGDEFQQQELEGNMISLVLAFCQSVAKPGNKIHVLVCKL